MQVRKRLRRRKTAVVFLDANISGMVYRHLRDLAEVAHWVTFWAPREEMKRGNGATHFSVEKKHLREMKNFFFLMGDRNVFKINGTIPARMPDRKLLSYMVSLVSKHFPEQSVFVFYTCDRKFLLQARMRDHPFLPLFAEGGSFSFIPLVAPTSQSPTEFVARQIREDLTRRLDLV